MKRYRRRLGDILEVPLDDGYHSYALTLEEPLFSFFKIRTKQQLTADTIMQLPVLFKIWVMRSAPKEGNWKVIDKVSQDMLPVDDVTFFKQDILNGNLTAYKKS